MSSSFHFQEGLNTISKPELTGTKCVFFPLQDEDTLENSNSFAKLETWSDTGKRAATPLKSQPVEPQPFCIPTSSKLSKVINSLPIKTDWIIKLFKNLLINYCFSSIFELKLICINFLKEYIIFSFLDRLFMPINLIKASPSPSKSKPHQTVQEQT